MRSLTGYHAIESYLQHITEGDLSNPDRLVLYYSRHSKRIDAIIRAANDANIRVTRVDSGELDARFGSAGHRGAALEVPYIAHAVADLRTFLAADIPATATVLVLDGITDPHNLGAILRSADQFGVDLVILPSRRAARLNDTVLRTSAGAATEVPIVTVSNLNRALLDLKEAGFWVYGADIGGENVVASDVTGRVALVLGSEGEGLGRLVRETCDVLVRIPAFGTIDSLNVSVAAGVLLFEIRRQQGMFQD
jgi:23S rRNA (guanosine2251-2'-O)-methyltransferase